MAESIDKEIESIKAVLTALEPLSSGARISVLEYVVKRLQISLPAQTPSVVSGPNVVTGEIRVPQRPPSDQAGDATHIKDFREKKKPRSANEMASLVAYFLSELAPAKDRKKTVNAKDIETYFKIAEFPLPEHVPMTLPNAKAAGYFDAVGEGEYRLNAVGHNLVVHSMPRGSSSSTSAGKKRIRKARSNNKSR